MNRFVTQILMGAGLLIGLYSLTGCHARNKGAAKDALVDQLNTYGGPDTAKLKLKRNAPKKNELPGKITGSGWHIPWYAPDPKNPKAPPQCRLIADAKTGTMDSEESKKANRDFLITLQTVQATLFQNNKPAVRMRAPTLELTQKAAVNAPARPSARTSANDRTHTMVATGGVWIESNRSILLKNSLKNSGTGTNRSANQGADNPDEYKTTVTADKMEWDMASSKLVCTGHALLRVEQKESVKNSTKKISTKTKGKTGISTVVAERMEWDMSNSTLTCTGNPLLTLQQPDVPKITQTSPKIIYNDETHRFYAGN